MPPPPTTTPRGGGYRQERGTTTRRAGAVVKIVAKEESSRDLRAGDRAVHHNHTQFRIGVSEDSKGVPGWGWSRFKSVY